MRFSIFFTVLSCWIIWRFILPMKISRTAKVSASVVLLGISWISGATHFMDGGLLSPEYPRILQIAARTLEGAVLFFAAGIILRDAVIFLCAMAGRRADKAREFLWRDRRTAICLAASSAALAALGVHEGIRIPRIKERELCSPDLPEALDGFRFVHLSDTHASKLLDSVHCEALVEAVNSIKADAVFLTGDMVDGTKALYRRRDVAPLAGLKAPKGVWMCEGNHEHYGPYEDWVKELGSLGDLKWLRNSSTVIEVEKNGRTAQLVLGGVCDPMARRFGREAPDPVKTFEGRSSSRDPNAWRILLAHQPRYFDDYRDAEEFNLQLSGHTHGGQIIGMDQGVAIMNRGFSRGFYKRPDGTILYVHPGSGIWNGFPMRVAVQSEIAVFTLRRAPNNYPVHVRSASSQKPRSA